MPPQRSRGTCNQCRMRKIQVKCHRESSSGGCLDCQRLSFDCSFVSNTTTSNLALERKRNRACIECRSQKTKCSGDLPCCDGCKKRAKDCVYPTPAKDRNSPGGRPIHADGASLETSTFEVSTSLLEDYVSPSMMQPVNVTMMPHGATSSPQASWESSSSFHSQPRLSNTGPLPLPPVREQLHLITDFFRYIYPLPAYAFLNEVSITQRCLDQSLDIPLLLALCSVSALHLRYPKYYPTFTSSWISQAENLVWERIEEPRIFSVQALVLIVKYHIETSNYQKGFMLSSLAARGATALRLQYERTDLSTLAQEIRRRLMWCLVMMDVGLSIGLPECEVCNSEAVYLHFPCKEEDFDADRDASAGPLGSLPLDGIAEDGLFASVLRTSMVLRDVMRLKRQVMLFGQRIPQLHGMVKELNKTLQDIPRPHYTAAELLRYSRSRWMARYLMLQLLWHQTHCDIYRMFVPGYAEAAPEPVTSACSPAYIANAARMCLHHASTNISVLSDFSALGIQPAVVDIIIAICSYHACRLILFLSKSEHKPADSTLTPDQAATQATAVLALLRRLYPHGPAKLPARIISTLDGIIKAHAADKREPSRDSSDMEEDSDTHRPRFALAAQQQQRLGIHSILRHTRFIDDSNDAANGQTPARGNDQTSELPQRDAVPQTYPTHGSLSTAAYVGSTTDFLQSPLDEMTAAPQMALGMDPFIFGSMDNWSDLRYPTDFSAASDRDYF
ncbi:unnamed protein product [Clonostachys chloroleuca]|uniref:Zn(2)-C6 fungal-type domain-containing protein n=1 Tax=Clonostachys chloroleuca TaxID=1926264 RepID=A0AA35M2C5_9HYPO|nr:unnamed protein product [Clonostachys chloroleuca]